jgi:3-methyladenine DNA glycosylase AlkD
MFWYKVPTRGGIMDPLASIKALCRQKITKTPEEMKRFFKSSYSAHDHFLGISVPDLRMIAKEYKNLPLNLIERLIQSLYNEERLLGLVILIGQYPKHPFDAYTLYIKNLDHVNNWNLVDSSAHHILGAYLWDKDRSILDSLVQDPSLWKRRIAIVASLFFIKRGDLDSTFKLAEALINDKEDLIHKAVGWMLREAGKKDEVRLKAFLHQHGSMPKTMMRYALQIKATSNNQKNL